MSSEQILSPAAPPLADQTTARKLWYWGPVIGYAALIFYGSSLSVPPEAVSSLMKEVSDKALHVVEYAILGALSYRACRYAAGPRVAQSALSLAVAGCVLYGLSDEIHQLVVPFREADALDLLADSVGATAGGWTWMLLGRRSPHPYPLPPGRRG
mgnify:FL=1